MYPKHWTDKLFVAFGIVCCLVFSYMLGGVVFGAVPFFPFVGVCLASAISFLAGAGVKGSLLIGTPVQQVAGGLLGIILIGGCLWFVHWLVIDIAFLNLNIPSKIWIALSALIGFVGAIKPSKHLEK